MKNKKGFSIVKGFVGMFILITLMALSFTTSGCDCDGSSGGGGGGGTVYVDNTPKIKVLFAGAEQPKAGECGVTQYCVGAPMTLSMVVENNSDTEITGTWLSDLYQSEPRLHNSGNATTLDGKIMTINGVPSGGSGGGGGMLGVIIPPGEARIIQFNEYTSDILEEMPSEFLFHFQVMDGATLKDTLVFSKEFMFGPRPEEHIERSVWFNQYNMFFLDYGDMPYNLPNEELVYTTCLDGDCEEHVAIGRQTLGWWNELQHVREPNDDGDKVVDHYIHMSDSSNNESWYEMWFKNSIIYNATSHNNVAATFLDTTWRIMGKDFTVTGVGTSMFMQDGEWYNEVSSLTLMNDDDLTLKLNQVNTIITDGFHHELKLVATAMNPDEASISVDGDVIWLEVGQAIYINGIIVHLMGLEKSDPSLPNYDIAKVYTGSTEIILMDSNEVIYNGSEIDGTDVMFWQGWSKEPGTLEFDGLAINWTPEDDEYFAIGEGTMDPLGIMELRVLDLSPDLNEYTGIKFSTHGDEAEIEFTDGIGREWELPLIYDPVSGTVKWGYEYSAGDCDGRYLIHGDVCSASDYNNIEGVVIPVMTYNSYSSIEITNIDDLGDRVQVDMRDEFGHTWADKVFYKNTWSTWNYYPTNWNGRGLSFNIWFSDYSISVLNNTNTLMRTDGGAELELAYGGYLIINENYWEYDEVLDEFLQSSFAVGFTWNSIDDELNVNLTGAEIDMYYHLSKNTDDMTGTRDYGTEITHDGVSDGTLSNWANILVPPYESRLLVGAGTLGFTPFPMKDSEVITLTEEAPSVVIIGPEDTSNLNLTSP